MSEAFLSRWSRLKKTGAEAEIAAPIVVPPSEAEIAPKPAAQNEPVLENISQNLPPVESLTNDSDFTAFMQPKVPEALKRQALKKLFANPQFNVMDGLDVYVDDYSVSVPIPDDWYKDIPSWQAMLNPKPPMVVTDGGYAVDADSEEGIATLKAREEAMAEKSLNSENALALDSRTCEPAQFAAGAAAEPAHENALLAPPDVTAGVNQNPSPEISSSEK